MSKKIDPDKTHGQKVIDLFFKLFFSPYKYSLTELSQSLGCSKQTVGRIVDTINSSIEGIKIEDFIQNRKRYFRIKKEKISSSAINMSQSEYALLQMCCSFTKHLIGEKEFNQAANALGKTQVLLEDGDIISAKHFGAFLPGTIDYSRYQIIIRDLINAMEERKVCKLTYHSIGENEEKVFYIKPLKLFSKDATIYLHAKMAQTPGKKPIKPKFDPLLVVHRIKGVELTETAFEFPDDFDFEVFYNKNFGVMKEDSFQVKVEFTGFVARYVKERVWSVDQEIIEHEDGKIELIFSATSEEELLSWILSHGHEARVVEPDWLIEMVQDEVNKIRRKYAFYSRRDYND